MQGNCIYTNQDKIDVYMAIKTNLRKNITKLSQNNYAIQN